MNGIPQPGDTVLNFIDGRWQPAASDKWTDRFDPADRSLLAGHSRWSVPALFQVKKKRNNRVAVDLRPIVDGPAHSTLALLPRAQVFGELGQIVAISSQRVTRKALLRLEPAEKLLYLCEVGHLVLQYGL